MTRTAAETPYRAVHDGQVIPRIVDGWETTGAAIANETRAVALVFGAFGDGMETARFIVRACNAYEPLLALAEKYLSECAECGGTGKSVTLTEAGEYGPDADCEQCADIRAVMTKVKGAQS
jgi:hypothetical protein